MGPNPPTILELRSSLVPQQPNRILIHKQIRIRLVIPEEVVMKPRFTVGILVLKAEELVCAIRYLGFLFQTTKILRSSKKQKPRTYRTHPTSGLEVLYRLRLT